MNLENLDLHNVLGVDVGGTLTKIAMLESEDGINFDNLGLKVTKVSKIINLMQQFKNLKFQIKIENFKTSLTLTEFLSTNIDLLKKLVGELKFAI